MRIDKKIGLIFSIIGFVFLEFPAQAQPVADNDTLTVTEKQILEKQNHFYDSLEFKAQNSKFLKVIYKFLITSPRPYVDKKALSLDHYNKMSGKTIESIDITPLEVFGPTFEDTARKAKSWLEKTSNAIHTKSNLKSIERMLMFKVGDTINPELIYENERIIRLLPYIRDLKFNIEQDTVNPDYVRIHLLTQDRFSLGASGVVEGMSSADVELYNQNIFGVGHEISVKFVGHLQRQPYLGVETYYKINNIRGKFIDISAGYMNTFRKEGFSFIMNKPFITTTVKWGFGASALRLFRTDRIFEDDPIITKLPMDLSFFSAWGGKSFMINPQNTVNSQIVVSAGFFNRTYFRRPTPQPEQNQFFSNSTFYLTGVTFTQRRYIQDQLIYSYGLIEDIPEGFKNEIVYGFDANEFGNRHYAHIFLSNGNLLINHKGYLYLSAGIGGFFDGIKYEQGQVQAGINFISRQVNAGRKRFRLFIRANYLQGLNRFDIEELELRRYEYIRGFTSHEATGKQRLSVNLEYVLFLRREFYKFSLAPFGFADLGIIGSNKELIFGQRYYSGIGLGIRLHNENLAFKTIQLRLAFYPMHPNDMSLVGFILNEQLKKKFYSFEPTAPSPLRFE